MDRLYLYWCWVHRHSHHSSSQQEAGPPSWRCSHLFPWGHQLHSARQPPPSESVLSVPDLLPPHLYRRVIRSLALHYPLGSSGMLICLGVTWILYLSLDLSLDCTWDSHKGPPSRKSSTFPFLLLDPGRVAEWPQHFGRLKTGPLTVTDSSSRADVLIDKTGCYCRFAPVSYMRVTVFFLTSTEATWQGHHFPSSGQYNCSHFFINRVVTSLCFRASCFLGGSSQADTYSRPKSGPYLCCSCWKNNYVAEIFQLHQYSECLIELEGAG